MTLYSPGGLNLADTTAPLILAYDDSGTKDVVFAVSSGGDLTITPDGGDISLAATLAVTGNVGLGMGAPANNALGVTEATDSQWIAQFFHSDADNPLGIQIDYTGGAPNGAADFFLRCKDTGATRFEVSSDGAITSAGGASSFGGTLAVTGNVGVGVAAHADRALDIVETDAVSGIRLTHSHAATPYGISVDFSAATPDNQTQYFLKLEDSTDVKVYIWSDGTIEATDFKGTVGADTPAAGAFTTGAFSGDVTIDAGLLAGGDDQGALGASGTAFSDLFLASGAVINFAAGDVTLTHSAAKVTWGGDGAVEIDFNNHEMTNVDIDSGAIDATAIGGTTPAAGAFTTGAFSGNVGIGTGAGANNALIILETDDGQWAGKVLHSDADNPLGIQIEYSGGAPNGVGDQFLQCKDTGATRAEIRSNGGLANFQGNDVDLSDARLKEVYGPTASKWDEIKGLEIVDFRYLDNLDSRMMVGVTAQQVQTVAPGLFDAHGWGDGEHHGVHNKDLWMYGIKTLQEAMERIEWLEEKLKKVA